MWPRKARHELEDGMMVPEGDGGAKMRIACSKAATRKSFVGDDNVSFVVDLSRSLARLKSDPCNRWKVDCQLKNVSKEC